MFVTYNNTYRQEESQGAGSSAPPRSVRACSGAAIAGAIRKYRPDIAQFAALLTEEIPGEHVRGATYSQGAAVLASKDILGVFRLGDHGSTFGGNPLGAYFQAQLAKVASRHVESVRGKGLLIGVVLKPEAGGARRFCEALERLAHLPRLHVSLDMDAVDPAEAPGVGTPVPGGLTFREAHLLMEVIADDGRTASIDVVEVNPILDQRNATGHMGVALVASLLGKSIL